MVQVLDDAYCEMSLRLTESQNARYKKAASCCGQTVRQWAISHLDAAVQKDAMSLSTTYLSPEPFDRFCAMLEAPLPYDAKALLDRKPVWK